MFDFLGETEDPNKRSCGKGGMGGGISTISITNGPLKVLQPALSDFRIYKSSRYGRQHLISCVLEGLINMSTKRNLPLVLTTIGGNILLFSC